MPGAGTGLGGGYSGTPGQILLAAQSAKPGSSEIILVDGVTATGYKLLQPDWGNAIWANVESGPRGTQGARAAGGEPQNRPLSIPLAISAASIDLMHAALSTLQTLDDEWRRFGGVITWRPKGATYKQYFDVLYSAGAGITNFDWVYHNQGYVVVTLAPVCAPYLRGDPMDIFDDFSADTSADYTVDSGVGRLLISGGQLVPQSTGNVRWRHTGRGYSYGDCQATVKFTTGSTVASINVGVFINGDTAGAENYIGAELTGGNLVLTKRNSGTPTTLNSTAFLLTANTTYWLRIRREGRGVVALVYNSEPSQLSPAAANAPATLSLLDNWFFVAGHAGLRLDVAATTERYDDFRVEPYSYGSPISNVFNVITPDERSLRPAIIGDAPALADLVVSQSGGSVAPIWGLGAWWQRPSVWNYVWNGDFEDDVDGWSVAAVAGVTGAATSIARSTTAARNKYGVANAQIVCPATANTGATFKINRRFYQGKDYVILVWASSALGTTLARCRLGVSGDIASSTPVALSTTPTLYTALWTPSADRDGAYVAAEITAATGTTWNIDAVQVVEGRTASMTNTVTTSETLWAVDRIPGDWPAAPFLAIVDAGTNQQEIVRVASYSNSPTDFGGGVFGYAVTVVRGMEGTSAGVHTSTDSVIPLPEIRSHYEGKGAAPPVGVLEAEAADTGNLYTWAITASGAARLGNILYSSGINAAGSVAADWLVDPHLLIPDDYTQGEIAVEVWARVNTHAGMTNPTAILSLAPETATVSAGVLTSNYAAIRYAEEYGAAGKVLVKPSSGAAYRMTRLGTIRFPVDRSRPLRSRLQVRITWSAATAADIGLDYLVLVPANQRALSPSGKANDANYPKFIGSTSETTKTVRSDLTAITAKPPLPAHPDHGLGGSLIELPQGNVDWLLKLSDLVPDDPTSNTTGETAERPAGSVHLAVTPRFRTARSS